MTVGDDDRRRRHVHIYKPSAVVYLTSAYTTQSRTARGRHAMIPKTAVARIKQLSIDINLLNGQLDLCGWTGHCRDARNMPIENVHIYIYIYRTT